MGVARSIRENNRMSSLRQSLRCNHVSVPSPPDLGRLTANWNARWPQTPPIAFLLRGVHPDLWVRFHSLPGSKRYAETDAERRIVLARHHAVLEALAPSSQCFVIATQFATDPSGTDSALVASTHWQTIDAGEHFEEPAQLYVTSLPYPSAELDDVLMACADWRLADVIVSPHDLRWLYHPYDGGADVIAPSTAERDQLKARFESWLSTHPAGL